MSTEKHKAGAVDRVLMRHLTARRSKTAGEVRFIKDRGGDDKDWGWVPPGASQREIDPDYKFDAKNLKPLAQTLRAALMALGHIQTARTTFTKIRSQTISPDGNLGGKGYVLPIKDIRKMLSNCDEALSALTDSIYDEMQAVHWHPDVPDSGGNPRERDDVKEIMDDVDEIREDPEDWAADEEASMADGGGKQARMKAAGKRTASVNRVATRWATDGAQAYTVSIMSGKRDLPLRYFPTLKEADKWVSAYVKREMSKPHSNLRNVRIYNSTDLELEYRVSSQPVIHGESEYEVWRSRQDAGPTSFGLLTRKVA